MTTWRTTTPTQKVFVCYTENGRAHIHHLYYNPKRAEKWKTDIEEIKEEMQQQTTQGNHVKVDELREKLMKDFNLSFYDTPIVQEVALE